MAIAKAVKSAIIEHLMRCEFRELCDNYCDDHFLWIIKGTRSLSDLTC